MDKEKFFEEINVKASQWNYTLTLQEKHQANDKTYNHNPFSSAFTEQDWKDLKDGI